MKRLFAVILALLFVIGIGKTITVSSSENDNHINNNSESSGKYGLIIEDGEVIDCKKATVSSEIRQNRENGTLPSSVDLSLSPYFPKIVGDQHQTGSCTTFATTYYQFTYEVNKYKNVSASTTSNDDIYCPQFVYSLAKESLHNGSSFEDCYNVLRQLGCIKYSDYVDENNQPINISSDAVFRSYHSDNTDARIEALNIRADESYFTIDTRDINGDIIDHIIDLTANGVADGLDSLKEQLADGKAVTVATNYYPEYAVVSQDPVTKVALYMHDIEEKHALTVVGYNDNYWYDVNHDNNQQKWETGAVKIVNSWGIGYENLGYMWILYDAFNYVSCCDDNTYSNVTDRVPFLYDGLYTIDNIGAKQCHVLYTLDVEEKDVLAIGKINIETSNLKGIIYKINEPPTYEPMPDSYLYPNLPPTSVSYSYNFSGDIIFDSSIISSSFDDFLTTQLCVFSIANNNSNIYNIEDATIHSFSLIDDMGATIKEFTNEDTLIKEGQTVWLSSYFSVTMGDLNYDGIVDGDDLLILYNYCNGVTNNLSKAQMFLADFDEDGVITSTDYSALSLLVNG